MIGRTNATGFGSSSGTDTSDATAVANEILAGETAYGPDGKITGTMPNNGAVTQELSAGEDYAIPAGYHSGGGKVSAIPLSEQTTGTAAAADILSGKTAWVNGAQVSGAMENRGAVTQSLNAGGTYTIPAGYHSGAGKVTANSLASQTSATATAADIASGKTAWVNGVKVTGAASGGNELAEISIVNESTADLAIVFVDPTLIDTRPNDAVAQETLYAGDPMTITTYQGSMVIIGSRDGETRFRDNESPLESSIVVRNLAFTYYVPIGTDSSSIFIIDR